MRISSKYDKCDLFEKLIAFHFFFLLSTIVIKFVCLCEGQIQNRFFSWKIKNASFTLCSVYDICYVYPEIHISQHTRGEEIVWYVLFRSRQFLNDIK